MPEEPAQQRGLSTEVYRYTAGPYRVNYSNTDRMGHAYYAEYLVWFECARTDLLRSLGPSYRQWEDEHGVFLPVTECTIRYRRSAQYDDLLVVDTQIARLTRASISFEYTIRRQEEAEVIATGTTSHVFVNSAGKVLRTADRLLPQFFAGSDPQ
jgi:acyl-CoA thioester hydrolase